MLLTFAGYALGYFNIFFVLPKYLTEAEIGIYRVLFDVAYLIYPFLQFGGINIVNKFFFEQKGNDGRWREIKYGLWRRQLARKSCPSS